MGALCSIHPVHIHKDIHSGYKDFSGDENDDYTLSRQLVVVV